MTKLYSLTLLTMLCTLVYGQNVLLVEHFDYPADAEIRDFGWTPHSAGATNPLLVTNGGLSWNQTDYLGSGVGNAVAVDNTGSDENRPLSSWVNSGSLYVSFLMNVPTEVTSGNAGFFFHLGQYSNTAVPDFSSISNMFRGRTYVAPGNSAETYRVGLNFNAAAVPTDAENLSGELNVGETYLEVLKYEVVEGDNNDLVSIYVFEDGDDIAEEPLTATIGPLGGTAGDLELVQLVALRQYDANQNIVVDGIIAQDGWNLLAAAPFTGPELVGPVDGTILNVSGDPTTEAVITWTEAENAPGPVTYEWQLALRAAGNFDAPLATLASDDAGTATTLTVSFEALDGLLASLDVDVDQTVEAIWRVVAASEGETAPSINTFDIDIIRGELLGLANNALSREMLIYPNPSAGVAFLRIGEIPAGTMNVRIVNQLGQTVRSSTSAAQSGQLVELDLAGIPSGIYFTVIAIDDLQGVKRLVIQ